jgi:hypothetical protein
VLALLYLLREREREQAEEARGASQLVKQLVKLVKQLVKLVKQLVKQRGARRDWSQTLCFTSCVAYFTLLYLLREREPAEAARGATGQRRSALLAALLTLLYLLREREREQAEAARGATGQRRSAVRARAERAAGTSCCD